jgi:ribosomal 30S subunit maturation factor RimM
VYLGYVSSAHGVHGFVRVACTSDYDRLSHPIWVGVRAVGRRYPRDVFVAEGKHVGGGEYLVQFEGVKARSAAERFKGCEIWMKKSIVKETAAAAASAKQRAPRVAKAAATATTRALKHISSEISSKGAPTRHFPRPSPTPTPAPPPPTELEEFHVTDLADLPLFSFLDNSRGVLPGSSNGSSTRVGTVSGIMLASDINPNLPPGVGSDLLEITLTDRDQDGQEMVCYVPFVKQIVPTVVISGDGKGVWIADESIGLLDLAVAKEEKVVIRGLLTDGWERRQREEEGEEERKRMREEGAEESEESAARRRKFV